MLTVFVNTLTGGACKFPDMTPRPLQERARSARLKAGFATEKDASKAIGCSRTLVISWENGSGSLKGSRFLLRAAKAYGVSAEWLSDLGARDERHATVTTLETPADHIRFPLLEGFAGMGRGDYVGDFPEIVDFVEVTREWASQKLRGVPHESVRVITGRGQSMRGTYNDGDLIFLDSRIKQFDADAAYCYRWGGRVHIKRLQHIGGTRVRIISANPEWPAIEVDVDELEIGGMALAAWTLKEF